jgi:hypothetical protein
VEGVKSPDSLSSLLLNEDIVVEVEEPSSLLSSQTRESESRAIQNQQALKAVIDFNLKKSVNLQLPAKSKPQQQSLSNRSYYYYDLTKVPPHPPHPINSIITAV